MARQYTAQFNKITKGGYVVLLDTDTSAFEGLRGDEFILHSTKRAAEREQRTLIECLGSGKQCRVYKLTFTQVGEPVNAKENY